MLNIKLISSVILGLAFSGINHHVDARIEGVWEYRRPPSGPYPVLTISGNPEVCVGADRGLLNSLTVVCDGQQVYQSSGLDLDLRNQLPVSLRFPGDLRDQAGKNCHLKVSCIPFEKLDRDR